MLGDVGYLQYSVLLIAEVKTSKQATTTTMVSNRFSKYAALTALLFAGEGALAFAPPSGIKSSKSSFIVSPSSSSTQLKIGGFFSGSGGKDQPEQEPIPVETLDSLVEVGAVTPEGFGFSCPASRVLNTSNRGDGYYKASSEEAVVDVIAAITQNSKDIALVFDQDELLGIFTEADYIKVRLQ